VGKTTTLIVFTRARAASRPEASPRTMDASVAE
jgi:hypothetical protein